MRAPPAALEPEELRTSGRVRVSCSLSRRNATQVHAAAASPGRLAKRTRALVETGGVKRPDPQERFLLRVVCLFEVSQIVTKVLVKSLRKSTSNRLKEKQVIYSSN